MRVIERFVRGKHADPQLCEDLIVVTSDFGVVIDGATDKANREFHGRCGGRFAAETVAAAFEAMPAEADIGECVRRLTQALADALARSAVAIDLDNDDAPSAVFVAYSSARQQVWRVGDASWRAERHAYQRHKAIDVAAASARSVLLRALVLAGERPEELMRSDPGRQMILPLLRNQFRFRNSDDDRFGYGALDGRTVPQRFLEVWPIEAGTEIALASDGYPKLCATLADTEAYLAKDLGRDPMRIGRHCETKGRLAGQVSYDDRAYLRLIA